MNTKQIAMLLTVIGTPFMMLTFTIYFLIIVPVIAGYQLGDEIINKNAKEK